MRRQPERLGSPVWVRLGSWFARFPWWSRLGQRFRFLHGLGQGEVVFAGDDFASAFLFEVTPGVAGHRAASAGGVFVLRKGMYNLYPPFTQLRVALLHSLDVLLWIA